MDFFGNQNFNRNDILNFVVHKGTSLPVSANAGQLFFNTITEDLYIYRGTAWVKIATGTVAPPVPGLISMWSGTLASIPSDWKLCDGTSGTPNLLNKFIKNVTVSTEAGSTGGSNTHTHTIDNIHTHTFSPGSTSVQPAGAEPSGGMTVGGGTHGHPFTGGTTGISLSSSDAASSLPPYYELAFIIKT